MEILDCYHFNHPFINWERELCMKKKLKKHILFSLRISVALYLIFFAIIQAYIGIINPTLFHIFIFFQILALIGLYGVIKLKKWCLFVSIFYFAFYSLVGIVSTLSVGSLVILFANLLVIIYLLFLIKELKVKKTKGKKR